MTRIFWIGLCIAFSSLLSLDAGASAFDVTPHVELGWSSPEQMDPAQVDFRISEMTEINTGYTNRDLWLKFSLRNDSDTTWDKMLYLTSPLVGQVFLFRSGEQEPLQSGGGFPLSQRTFKTRLAAFPIRLAPQEEATYFLKQGSHHAVHAQLILEDRQDFLQEEDRAKSFYLFYCGGIICLLIYNLLLGIFSGQKDYLYYALFAGVFGMTAMTLQGVVDTYLLPNSKVVFLNSLMFFSSLTVIAAALFTRRFLGITHRGFPVGYWGMHVILALAAVPLLVSPFAASYRQLNYFGYWIDLTVLGAILFFVFCGIFVGFKHKYRLGYYFLLSWLVVVIGVFVWFGSLHGLLPMTVFSQYSILLANLGEMLVLSLGLAYKIRMMDEERQIAQREAEDKKRYHRLVRVLAHDVANTVSGITYHTEMLKELSEGSPQEGHVSRIDSSLEQLRQILKSVRHEEVFYAFRSHGELQMVELAAACWDAVNHHSWQLESKNIRVTVEVPWEKFIRADKTALTNQVLSNLLSNSIKFSDVGSSILMVFSESESELILSIKDQGVGIPPGELEHLFKGKKLVSSKGTADEEGTGFGTSLIGEYMSLFGGRIEVRSIHRSHNPHSGTTVSLIFPLV